MRTNIEDSIKSLILLPKPMVETESQRMSLARNYHPMKLRRESKL